MGRSSNAKWLKRRLRWERAKTVTLKLRLFALFGKHRRFIRAAFR